MWIPLAFVLLFSTGFICARLGTMDAEPFTLLLVRSLLVLPVLGAILWVRRLPSQWGSRAQRGCQMGVGMLLHGAYLGGVFAAVKAGLPAGLTALLVSLHPLATAALSLPLLGVRLGPRQWSGLALGALGASLVLGGGLEVSQGWPLIGLTWCLVALVGISSATLWQKRLSGGMGMVEGLIFQYLGAALVFSIAATWVGSFTFDPTPRLLLTLAWLVGAISVGAIWLLMMMIARGEAHQVARTFFLVPPCAAVMAWLLFDEQWTAPMIIGAALVVAGLALDRPGTNQASAARAGAAQPRTTQPEPAQDDAPASEQAGKENARPRTRTD
ncbi:drug/metabolite transporter (DMT)-like permease [Onishia taeanensis]|uniref:Drug/metabolite transporter (DMT)-like permease n=1 Tax=Onishia taeanensis TaxID=284577 RepID=A0A328Y2Z0_9GAMM|nr:DMT family transporter [Halomonas taeanensis]RAR64561.1 drug/metabolite transporter (DMT)-like permease [Halomonas taeanensis]